MALYGYRMNHEDPAGQHDNTDVAEFVANNLDLRFDSITRKLRKNISCVKGNVEP